MTELFTPVETTIFFLLFHFFTTPASFLGSMNCRAFLELHIS